MGLEAFILDTPHELPCPECGLTLFVALRQIRRGITIQCPRCRTELVLREDGRLLSNVGSTIRNLVDVADRLETSWRP